MQGLCQRFILAKKIVKISISSKKLEKFKSKEENCPAKKNAGAKKVKVLQNKVIE